MHLRFTLIFLAVLVLGLAQARALAAETDLEKGFRLQETGDYKAGAAAMRGYLVEHPENAEAHKRLGICLTLMSRDAEAAQEFKEALRLNPGDKEVRAMLERAPASTKPFYVKTMVYKVPAPRPWVLLTLDLGGPLLAGPDLSVFLTKNWAVGLGGTAVESQTWGWDALHPHLEYYWRRHWGWCHDFALGYLHAQASNKSAAEFATFDCATLSWGMNYFSAGFPSKASRSCLWEAAAGTDALISPLRCCFLC